MLQICGMDYWTRLRKLHILNKMELQGASAILKEIPRDFEHFISIDGVQVAAVFSKKKLKKRS